MTNKGPGRTDREGLTVMELFRIFPDDQTAEKWFEARRWPDGIRCSDCGCERYGCVNHKDYAIPLQEPRLPCVLQCPQGNRDAVEQTRIAVVGDCNLYGDDEPKGSVQHEGTS